MNLPRRTKVCLRCRRWGSKAVKHCCEKHSVEVWEHSIRTDGEGRAVECAKVSAHLPCRGME